MTTLEAHALFAARTDRSVCDVSATVDGCDVWPAVMTAYASLAGMLDDCQDDAGLDEAVKHGVSLMEAGVLTDEQLADEGERVIGAVLEWGERLELAAMGAERN
jgi:hypothetical protein